MKIILIDTSQPNYDHYEDQCDPPVNVYNSVEEMLQNEFFFHWANNSRLTPFVEPINIDEISENHIKQLAERAFLSQKVDPKSVLSPEEKLLEGQGYVVIDKS